MTIRQVTLSLLFLTAAGFAQGSTYIAIEGTAGSLDVDPSASSEIDPGGLRLRLGTRVDKTFDIETHFGFLRDNNTDSFDHLDASFAGVYLKGYLPVGYNSALFALGGMTVLELGQDVDGQRFTDSRGGFSYGFGLETQLSENTDLTADYMRYIADDGLFDHFSAVSFGVKLYF